MFFRSVVQSQCLLRSTDGKLPGRRQPRPHPGALFNGETPPCHASLWLLNTLPSQSPRAAKTCFIDASAAPAALSFSAQRFRANSAGPAWRGIASRRRSNQGAAPGQKKRPCAKQGQCYPHHKDVREAVPMQDVSDGAATFKSSYDPQRQTASGRPDLLVVVFAKPKQKNGVVPGCSVALLAPSSGAGCGRIERLILAQGLPR